MEELKYMQKPRGSWIAKGTDTVRCGNSRLIIFVPLVSSLYSYMNGHVSLSGTTTMQKVKSGGSNIAHR